MWITFIPDAENIQKSTDRIVLSDCYTERFIYQSGVFFFVWIQYGKKIQNRNGIRKDRLQAAELDWSFFIFQYLYILSLKFHFPF